MNQKPCTCVNFGGVHFTVYMGGTSVFFKQNIILWCQFRKKNIVLYAKRGKQGHVEEYFALDRVKVNYNEGLGSKPPLKPPFATMD